MKTYLKIKTGLRSWLSGNGVKLFTAVFLTITAVTGIAYAARPRLTLSADKKEIGKGGTLKVVAEMSWKQSEDIIDDIIIVKVTPPSCPILDLADSKQAAISQLTGDGVYARKTMEYYFTAREKGTGIIDPVVVEYFAGSGQEEKDIVKSESINIKVVSYLSSLVKKLSIGLVFAVLTALLAGVILFLKNRIKSSMKKKAHEIADTHLEEEFLANIKMFSKYMIEGDYRKYYTYASGAMDNYINKKYDISLPVKTGGMELDKLPEQLGSLYSGWMNIAEKARFSGYQPEKNEQEKLMRETERYFKSLIPDKDPGDE